MIVANLTIMLLSFHYHDLSVSFGLIRKVADKFSTKQVEISTKPPFKLNSAPHLYGSRIRMSKVARPGCQKGKAGSCFLIYIKYNR